MAKVEENTALESKIAIQNEMQDQPKSYDDTKLKLAVIEAIESSQKGMTKRELQIKIER